MPGSTNSDHDPNWVKKHLQNGGYYMDFKHGMNKATKENRAPGRAEGDFSRDNGPRKPSHRAQRSDEVESGDARLPAASFKSSNRSNRTSRSPNSVVEVRNGDPTALQALANITHATENSPREERQRTASRDDDAEDHDVSGHYDPQQVEQDEVGSPVNSPTPSSGRGNTTYNPGMDASAFLDRPKRGRPSNSRVEEARIEGHRKRRRTLVEVAAKEEMEADIEE